MRSQSGRWLWDRPHSRRRGSLEHQLSGRCWESSTMNTSLNIFCHCPQQHAPNDVYVHITCLFTLICGDCYLDLKVNYLAESEWVGLWRQLARTQ